MVATPDGHMSRYLFGIEYSPKDLRLALVDSSAGKVGTLADKLLLDRYHYDPATGKYGPVVMRLVRVAGVLTVGALAGFILVMHRRERIAQQAALVGEPR